MSTSGTSNGPICTLLPRVYAYLSVQRIRRSPEQAVSLFLSTARRQSTPCFVHHSQVSAGQFVNPVRLAQRDSLVRNQVSANAQRNSTRQNEIGGCLLVDASRRNQRNLREWLLQGSNVTDAADLRAGKNFNEIGAGLP